MAAVAASSAARFGGRERFFVPVLALLAVAVFLVRVVLVAAVPGWTVR